MAKPQIENGYTRIANEILEELSFAGINGSEYRVLLVVIRKTYGFNKKKDRISLSQFQLFTNMNRPQAVRTLQSLVSKRILLKENGSYSFNKNWEEWVVCKRIPSIQKDTTASIQLDTKSSIQLDTYKRKKDNITKDMPEQSSGIPLIIDLFKEINPAYKKWYGNTTQRKAVANLLERNGMEQLQKVIALLPKTNKMQYLPTITTPLQLEDKWASLEAGLLKEKKKTKREIIL